jgi:dihydroorotate dehydrogenase (fumarate)
MDLTTCYMGLQLRHPLVASASPLTGRLHTIRQLEDAGASAVVLPSLFQDEIEISRSRSQQLVAVESGDPGSSVPGPPETVGSERGSYAYLDEIQRTRDAIDVPVIASLNCTTSDGWIEHARLIEQAGAHGLELNTYFIPTDMTMTGYDVERRYVELVRVVRETVTIPIAIKLSPYFSSMGNMALQLQNAGADALVLFNRFYQPDFDTASLQVVTDLGLSDPNEMRLPLLWLAVLSGRVSASLGATTGVATADDVVKFILAGADAVMTTSALLRHGPGHMASLLTGLREWLDARALDSLEPVHGIMSQRRLRDPQAIERANYLKILREHGQP